MNEDVIRREIQTLIQSLGYVYLHIPRNTRMVDGKVITPGRPDIWGVRPDGSIVVEVKDFDPKKRRDDWIYASEIADNQRAWLDWLQFCISLPAFLAIGTKIGNRYHPRRLWFVPWYRWVFMEKHLVERAGKVDPLQKIGVKDLEEFCAESEITWLGARLWQLPPDHPLWIVNSIRVTNVSLKDFPAVSHRFETGAHIGKQTGLSKD